MRCWERRRLAGSGILLALLLVATGGCGGGEVAEAPPEIQYGLEECSFCRMIVSEERFAAAARSAAGEETRFDDVGCLRAYLSERGSEVADGSVWVHDHESGDWLPASEAWFVRSETVSTPMGSGIVAFAARRRAEGFAADEGAEVRGWEDWSAEPHPTPARD